MVPLRRHPLIKGPPILAHSPIPIYNHRIIDIEKSSSNFFVYTASGGMAPECAQVNNRLLERITGQLKKTYAIVIIYIRTKLQ